MTTPIQVSVVAEDRRQDAIAWASRARLVAAATRPSPATPRTAGRVRAGLRQAVAALVAFAAIS